MTLICVKAASDERRHEAEWGHLSREMGRPAQPAGVLSRDHCGFGGRCPDGVPVKRELNWGGIILLFILGLTQSGCRALAGISDEARKIKEESYDYVYTVDSRIPQKVRRGADPVRNNGASPVAVLEGDRAKEMVRNSKP